MALNKKEAKRLKELEDNALNAFIDNTDYDIIEWLDIEERKEYYELYRKDTGTCLIHVEQECECFERDKNESKKS